jgi:hypothetical protein
VRCYSSPVDRYEVIEVRSLEDAQGYACSQWAIAECGDCGRAICSSHCGSVNFAEVPSAGPLCLSIALSTGSLSQRSALNNIGVMPEGSSHTNRVRTGSA